MKIGRYVLSVVFVLVAGIIIRYGVNKLSVYGSIEGHTTPLKAPVPAYTRSLHPNYPYSIIPGGAYSATELRNADREDPIVKEHYADFDMKKAQMVQLTDDRYQYVSYRLHKKVFWTKKKLRIPKGELLLTDGDSWARARCGNRLSGKPHTQVSAEEPPVNLLSIPPMQLGMPMQLVETPVLGELSSITPVDIERFPPVLPPSSASPPPELPPLGPTPSITPIIPVMPIYPPGGTPPGGGPPVTTPPTSTPPGVTPPPISPPIVIPPPGNPPVSAVPEPKAIYLFLVTFVISLYGLTRMVPGQEKRDSDEDAR